MKTFISFILLAFSTLTQAVAADFMVSGAYARETPPNVPNSAAFLQLMNHTDKAVRLVGVKSDIADKVELHNHTMVDGMMKMRQVDAIEVAAMATVELKPGGFHIMMMGLKQPLKTGQSVDFILVFEDGTELSFAAPVQKVGEHKKHAHH
ncbi:copper chaperone PCu(A)C [Motilimonas pumila]|nr:copper chaperone PCu(A)C [Motilimonas pumila]